MGRFAFLQGPVSFNDCLQANLEHEGTHLLVLKWDNDIILVSEHVGQPEKVAPGYTR